jgi:hypothetical protein
MPGSGFTPSSGSKTPKINSHTHIMRDWIFPHMGWFFLISIVWYAGILAWLHWQPYPAAIVGILSALVWAHLSPDLVAEIFPMYNLLKRKFALCPRKIGS